MELMADIFGALGILCTVILYQQKKSKSLLVYKLVLDIVWLVHYAFLGAFSGAVVCVIAALREIVFVKRDRTKRGSIVWLPIFIIVAIVCTAFTWDNIFSLFTCIASCIAVVSFFIANPKLSRILVFPVSACMLTYDIACGSFAGIINECFAMSSSVIGILRHDLGKKKNDTDAK